MSRSVQDPGHARGRALLTCIRELGFERISDFCIASGIDSKTVRLIAQMKYPSCSSVTLTKFVRAGVPLGLVAPDLAAALASTSVPSATA